MRCACLHLRGHSSCMWWEHLMVWALEISAIPVAWLAILLSGAAGNTLLIPALGAPCRYWLSALTRNLGQFCGGSQGKDSVKTFLCTPGSVNWLSSTFWSCPEDLSKQLLRITPLEVGLFLSHCYLPT